MKGLFFIYAPLTVDTLRGRYAPLRVDALRGSYQMTPITTLARITLWYGRVPEWIKRANCKSARNSLDSWEKQHFLIKRIPKETEAPENFDVKSDQKSLGW